MIVGLVDRLRVVAASARLRERVSPAFDAPFRLDEHSMAAGASVGTAAALDGQHSPVRPARA